MIKKHIYTLIGLFVLLVSVTGQDYLSPSSGYKTFPFMPDYTNFGAFDLSDSLIYTNDGDTIYCMDLESRQIISKWGKPEDYSGAYVSFLTLAPDGNSVWAGYTIFGNSDDRIYNVDVRTGGWTLQAIFPGNFDLEFWNDSILVSGLNSSDWTTPCALFLLDTSGSDQHRKIVEVGGYSAGLAVDGGGNLYFGTSFAEDPNAIYRWDSAQIALVVGDTATSALRIEDGEKLTDLPAGINDCEVDIAGNLVFNFNDFVAENVMALWNGMTGNGLHFDTLAVAASDWLGPIKSQGNIREPVTGNRVFTVAYGQPLTIVHSDYIPVMVKPLHPVTGLETAENVTIDLESYFADPDDEDMFTFEVLFNADPGVAIGSILGNELSIDFIAAGQSNIIVQASNAGQEISEVIVVGVQPEISGEHLISDFEDLTLDPESFWNGGDESGAFSSGITRFYNDYNPEWFSWSGWAYTNSSNNITPGWLNQYSAITGGGNNYGTGPSESGAYGVSYAPWPSVVDFVDGKPRMVEGLYVTNSTYTALSMEQGDGFSKKFGGADGSDPDYYKLMIWGQANGIATDSIEFYLADYRYENQDQDYIIKTWQWVDLSSLGMVDSLLFHLTSSDMGDWGMNTPGYFCLDDLHVIPQVVPVEVNPVQEINLRTVKVYPNPSTGIFVISANSDNEMDLKIYSLTGALVYEDHHYMPGQTIDMSVYPEGSYVIRIADDRGTISKIIHIL